VEWEESQAKERAAGGPKGRKSGTVSRRVDGATKQGEGDGDDAGRRIVADGVDLEKELAVEEEMERQEGEYARQLFSLREEETRIISEPKRRFATPSASPPPRHAFTVCLHHTSCGGYLATT
jgi:hypothetical protein